MATTLDVALSQVGVKEATGRNDGTPADRYNHGEQLPWCAAFVLWCNEQSSEPRYARSRRDLFEMRSVQVFEDRCKERGTWHSQGPASGDVVFFASRDGSDTGVGRHIGIIQTVDVFEDGVVLHTVEGNFGNQVSLVVHDLRDPKVRARVTGYARSE